MKRFLVSSSFVSLLATSAVAHAQTQATARPDPNAEPASTATDVIVTGTRQTGVRAADSAAPIQLIDSNALTKVAQPDLVQGLEQTVPSFNAETYGQDTAAAVLTAALRGLNPNDTLVPGQRQASPRNIEPACRSRPVSRRRVGRSRPDPRRLH